MTGCGTAHSKHKSTFIEVTAQSLNSRFLEVRFSLPPAYASLEGELRKQVQKKFRRGHIDILINRGLNHKNTKAQWSRRQALKWKAMYKKMAAGLKMKNNIDLLHLSQQPGVISVQQHYSSVSQLEKQSLKNLLKKAIALCEKERTREGKALKQEFQKNIRALRISLKNIKTRWLKQKQKKKMMLKKQIKKTRQLQNIEAVTSAISRIDIEEELSRLIEHIKIFQSMIISKSVIGKQMTFYLQEMIREINTIGSKSQDAGLTYEAVRAKTIIETMREQAQNVE